MSMLRFVEKIDYSSECWTWSGSLDTSGYGLFRDGKLWKAHRWAWTRTVGPIPPRMQIDHLCRNRACVNPDHMEVVTQRENMRRGTGFSARNARKTHCPQGHEYTPDNTVIFPSQPTSRRCLTCTRKWSRESERRRRAKLRQP